MQPEFHEFWIPTKLQINVNIFNQALNSEQKYPIQTQAFLPISHDVFVNNEFFII